MPHLAFAQVNQISIERIAQMPNEPSPYVYQDWKEVARGYDELIFDLNKSGQYLPTIFRREKGLNYPENPSFGLDTYIGTNNENAGEAINVLPALVGASLSDIDKSNQNGFNWILASQDYFNKKNEQFLYLNNIGGQSGNDWWYDMMPNIYFYQLYDLYGGIGDADFQFQAVANQFAKAVRNMGGSDTPWQAASMNYRAWDFKNNVPNAVGVIEPEAAGAFAWVLYHAYKKTGNKEYLKATEWSLEFLLDLESNPSYELQLPYGAYTAAKMNAEIGTEYNIEKLLNWIFNKGPLRNWGTIVGKWGGLDMSGIVGEINANGNDYAFQLNGLQQAAALVPLARYDKRFSRAIAKWLVNLSNSTRYFYPNFLPAALQDSKAWSDVHDPNNYIGYEALRATHNGLSPFATGDAIKGGWAATNLSLYSTSSIGYLGALIEATNVPKILQLDLLKTDFYKDQAYPSYLLFNPYAESKTVQLDVGTTNIDIYEVLSERFLHKNVSGLVSIEIPANEAISIVYTPVNGTLRYEQNKLLIDEVVVDYQQQEMPYNTSPRIQSLAAERPEVTLSDTLMIYAKAIDEETSDLTYQWHTSAGNIEGSGTNVKWIAPEQATKAIIKLLVTDKGNNQDSAFLEIETVEVVNIPPVIESINPNAFHVEPNASLNINTEVFDENGDVLAYNWTAEAGNIGADQQNTIWNAPSTEGIYQIKLRITDQKGGEDTKTIDVLVRDFSQIRTANLIAHYPFSGSANDISGNELHGEVFGAKLTKGHQEKSQEAYFFDGRNDHIAVANEDVLNFTEGISVSCFLKADAKNTQEAFLVSHGSWQNRWKVSLTPEKRIRWTIQNANKQITDLDSKTIIQADSFYHVSANYDGQFLSLYIDGQLESFTTFSGAIRTTDIGLEIAQMLPDNQAHNFNGILDDIQIYDNALIPNQVSKLAGVFTTSYSEPLLKNRSVINLFPNPASEKIHISFLNFKHTQNKRVQFTLLDLNGKVHFIKKENLNKKKTLNIPPLSKGIYFLKIQIDTEIYYKKVVIGH